MMTVRGCGSPYCANNPLASSYEAKHGFLCSDCERIEENENETNPRCSVCECRRSEHGDVWPCDLDSQD